MRNRYESGNTSKDKLKEPSPKSRENINIQIFNITARNRKVSILTNPAHAFGDKEQPDAGRVAEPEH